MSLSLSNENEFRTDISKVMFEKQSKGQFF